MHQKTRMEKKWITTEQLLQSLKNDPDNEHEYRRWLGGILFSTHWFLYDSEKQQIGDSSNWFHHDGWYTETEFLECYAGAWWHRDA